MTTENIHHPKIIELCKRLGVPFYAGVGIIKCIEGAILPYSADGNIVKYGRAVLATAIGWEGDPDLLLDALISSGWVKPDDGEEYEDDNVFLSWNPTESQE